MRRGLGSLPAIAGVVVFSLLGSLGPVDAANARSESGQPGTAAVEPPPGSDDIRPALAADASNLIGRGVPSSTTTAVTVAPQPATYHAISPVRVLDTRYHNGLSARLIANTPGTFQVTGRSDTSPQIPDGASAVTGNVTVVGSSAGWAVYLGPTPIAGPTTSTINFGAGQTTGNGLTVALSSTGTLSATFISSAGATTDLVFDVTGYFTPDRTGATYHPMTPARELDTRSGNGLVGQLVANTPRTFIVAGRNGVPSGAKAVTGNVTAVGSSAGWAVYLGPVALASPATSTVNFTAGAVAGNNLTVALSGTGTLSATYMGPASATTDLVFDVTGYYTADMTGGSFVPLNPARLLDTRTGSGPTGRIPTNTPRTFAVAGHGGVPSSAIGVSGNVTVVDETAGWAVFLGPNPTAAPTTSTINFVLGDVKGNGLTVALGAGGNLSATYIGSAGNTTDLVFDVTGYFAVDTSAPVLKLTPAHASVTAGSNQPYAASLDGVVVTSTTTLAIVAGPGGVISGSTSYPAGSAVPGAVCTGNSCTATLVGVYAVVGHNGATTSQAVDLTITPAAAAHLSLTGLAATRAPGTVDNGMVVTARDKFGNVATGFADVVSFTSSDPLAAVPPRYLFTPADAGIHHFTAPNGVMFRTPGTQRVTVLDAVAIPGLAGSQTGIVVSGSASVSIFHAISPARLLDTRSSQGLAGKFNSGVARTLQVTGVVGIPAGAVAVTGNLIVVGSTSDGFLYAGPDAVDEPTISMLNFNLGDIGFNGLAVLLDSGGGLSITYAAPTAGQTTDVIFDANGYFTPGGPGATYHSIVPGRLLDTRTDYGLSDPLVASTPRGFAVTGQAGIPAEAIAVTGELTVVAPSNGWGLFIGPVATPVPIISTFNFNAGPTECNGVTVAVGGDGKLYVTYLSGAGNTSHVVFEVTGYYAP